MRVFATMAVTLLLIGCVRVALEPEAEAMRVTASQDAVKGCKSLGLARVRNHAHRMGANTVLLIGNAGSSGSSAEGEAFVCPTA